MASSSSLSSPQVTTVAPVFRGQPSRFFRHVGGLDSEQMAVVEEIFNRILTPLYGPQAKAIQQIKEGSDRACYLLYEGANPIGVLVFKTVLSDEFKEYGVTKSIEVKSLFIDHAQENSGRGAGSALVDKLKKEVARLGLNHEGIHVTVSETKEESLAFFLKKGFAIVHTWQERYQPKTNEYLLYSSAEQSAATSGGTTFSLSRTSGDIPELLQIIHNAHLDDIHSLKKLADGTFVSGSKDNSIYKWNERGELVKVVKEVEPTQQSTRNWITAIQAVNSAYWVSGERSGKVMLWRTEGDFVKEINVSLPSPDTHVSHQYNAQRVSCIAAGLTRDKPSLFVGCPTMFSEYNLIEGCPESITTVHDNDWVYCIHPLNDRSILTATGGTVDLWNRSEIGWTRHHTILAEGERKQLTISGQLRNQRPFISSLTPFAGSENLFSIALFDESVQAVDINTGQVIHRWSEHQGRVWQTESLGESRFASSGEDGTIKIWDLNSPQSIHTVADYSGPVSSMLHFDEHTLIGGSCPERAMTIGQGAQIRFYDTRKF